MRKSLFFIFQHATSILNFFPIGMNELEIIENLNTEMKRKSRRALQDKSCHSSSAKLFWGGSQKEKQLKLFSFFCWIFHSIKRAFKTISIHSSFFLCLCLFLGENNLSTLHKNFWQTFLLNVFLNEAWKFFRSQKIERLAATLRLFIEAYWMNHKILISQLNCISIFILPFIGEREAVIASTFELLVLLLLRIFKGRDKTIRIHYQNMTINYQFPCNIFQLKLCSFSETTTSRFLTEVTSFG